MATIELNSQITGIITGIKPYGLFVKINDDLSGFCHISNISNKFISDISKIYSIGDTVNGIILEQVSDLRVNISIKALEPESTEIPSDESQKIQNKPKIKSNNNSFKPENHSKNDSNDFKKEHKPKQKFENKQESETDSSNDFEKMMTQYKKASSEKLAQISRRNAKHSKSYRR